MKDTIKDKKTVQRILTRLTKKTHVLDIKLFKEKFSGIILYCTDTMLVISELEPFYINAHHEKLGKAFASVSEIENLNIVNYDFKLTLIDKISVKNKLAYSFELPDNLKIIRSAYKLVPDKSDNVSLSFSLKGSSHHKKVISITEKEIQFLGEMKYFEDKLGEKVFDVELRLPFKQLKFSGVFNKVANDEYKFRDYLFADANREYLDDYAHFDFSRKAGFDAFYRKMSEIYKHLNGLSIVAEMQKGIVTKTRKILIVDDKKIITDIIKEMIEIKSEHEVVTLNDSAETMKIIKSYKPDVMILDKNMPVPDGLQIVKMVRTNPDFCKLPIIIMTAYDDSDDYYKLEKMGIEDYLIKPVDSKKLLDSINKILTRKELNSIVIDKEILICSDDATFCDKMESILNRRGFRNSSICNLSYRESANKVDCLIIRNNTLGIADLAKIRYKKEFSESMIILIIDETQRADIFNFLTDQKTIIIRDSDTNETITAILSKLEEI